MSKFDEISADVLVCLVSYVDGFLDVLSITLFSWDFFLLRIIIKAVITDSNITTTTMAIIIQTIGTLLVLFFSGPGVWFGVKNKRSDSFDVIKIHLCFRLMFFLKY